MRRFIIGLVLCSLAAPSARAAPHAFISNYNGESISVIDLASNTVVRTITEVAPRRPNATSVHPDGNPVYVAIGYNAAGAVDVYDTVNGSRTDIIDVGFRPNGVAVSPDGSRLYVTGFYRSDLAVVNTASGEVTTRVEIGSGHMAVVVHPTADRVYVGDADSGNVSVVDSAGLTELTNINASGGSVNGLAISPDGSRLYASLPREDRVAVIDTAAEAEIDTVDVGNNPLELAVDPAGALLYVSNHDDDTVSVIDTGSNTAVATIAVGTGPRGIDVHPAGTRAYVTSFGQDLVTVIDTASNTVINDIIVGDGPISSGSFITPISQIQSAPDYHHFGQVDVGASAEASFTISNQGTATLEIATVAITWQDSGSFAIASDGCSNTALAGFGASCTLSIRFAPDLNGPKVAYVGVPSDDPLTPWLQIQVAGEGVAPDISIVNSVEPISARWIFFGSVPVGGTAVETLSVLNRGNAALTIGSVGGVDALAAPFALGQDTCSGQVLAPEAGCALTVSFNPIAAGSVQDSFDLPSDDPDEAVISLLPSGNGRAEPVGNILLSDGIEPFDDLELPFGDVAVGESGDAVVLMFNSGSAGALTVDSLSITGVGASDFTVEPGDGSDNSCGPLPITVPGPINLAMPPQLQPVPCAVTVRFTPGTFGDRVASLEIASSDPDDALVALVLSGRGLGPGIGVVAALDFETVDVGANDLRELALESVGTSPLTISDVRLTGAAELTLDPSGGLNPCGAVQGIELAPGHVCSLLVEFVATSAGDYSGTLEIDSDDLQRATATVSISATAVDPVPDAGLEDGSGDASSDAGAEIDGAEADAAAVGVDAGGGADRAAADGSGVGADTDGGGEGADAGSGGESVDEGCGCAHVDGARSADCLSLLLLVGAAWIRRRYSASLH